MAKRTDSPDRLPPRAEEAERGVFGCTLLSPEECMPILIARCPGPEVFYELRHQELYRQLCIMHDGRELIDMVTIRQRLIHTNTLNAVGGLNYIAELPDQVPSASNLEDYLEIVLEAYQLRQLVRTCTELVSRAHEPDADAGAMMEELRRSTVRIVTHRQSEWTLKQTAKSVIKDLEHDYESGGALTGLPTGFDGLNDITRGLQAGEFIVIAARPSVGKSAFVMNIAEHVAMSHHKPVGVFSLEMTKKAIVRRLVSAHSRINLRHLAGGALSPEEFPRLTSSAGKIAGAPLYIDDRRGQSDAQICAALRFMVMEHGIQLGIVDYLQLIQARRRRERRAYEIADICHNLKDICGELGIPLIVCAQLNRDIDKGSKQRRPRASDLRESGDIEQDADVIGLLHRLDKSHKSHDTVFVDLIIDKQRNGPTGDIELLFDKAICRFRSVPKIDDADVPSLPGI